MDIPKEDIKVKVINMIAESASMEASEITEESIFNTDIILDSLSFAEILMECEETFDMEIPMEDASNFKTVKDLIEYLDNKVNA